MRNVNNNIDLDLVLLMHYSYYHFINNEGNGTHDDLKIRINYTIKT